ncbi:hypothetical protein SAMN05421755_104112 [Nitrosomonas sp. Nm33]|nr:hypothetical protein SAMN05421755_104112 [Nitrosomonas sp. Nm33]
MTKVLVKTDVNQSIVDIPIIRMNDSIRCYMLADNGLQSCFRAIWNNFRIYLSMALKYIKNNNFAIGTATPFPADALCAKVRFIDLYRTLQRRFQLTALDNSLPHFKINVIDRWNRNISQLSCTGSSKIQRKTSNDLPEFCFSNRWRQLFASLRG